MAYPSPWSPSGASPRSPTVKSPSTPGSRRVRFDDDQSNPSIRFIPPTPLSPGNLDTPVEDYSNEPGLFDTPTTTMNPSMRPAWSARRPSMPTPPAFEEADVYYTPTDGPESEYNSRPLVIPPPPYDHVWRDILTANEAAFRLRDALSTTSTEDVRTLTKSYPPAVAARLNLHEHQQNMGGGSGGGGGGVGVWPLPSAPGTTVSMAASTVPTTPALTAATMSTPGSVFTSLPAFTGGSDPDFPHSALSLAHANLRDAFLLFSEQFPTRAEHFGLRGRELTYTTSDNPRRYDSRERGLGTPSGYPGTPGTYSGPGTPGGHHTPGTPGGYGYEDARGAGGGYGYGYAKPGDFTRPGMRHQDSNMSNKSFVTAASQPADIMLVTNGGAGEEEAMLNEDSLLCLVEDVDGACDALGENADVCKLLRLQVKELLKFLISSEELVWPPPPGSVHSLGEGVIRSILVQLCSIPPGESAARVSEYVRHMSNEMVEFARSQQFEIYNGVSPSPTDYVPPQEFAPPPAPPPIPAMYANAYPNPNAQTYQGSEKGGYTSSDKGGYTSPDPGYTSPDRGYPSSDKGGRITPASSATGPYINPNRLADTVGSHSPYANSSPGGTYSNLGASSSSNLGLVPPAGAGGSGMGMVRRMDPLEVLNDPHGLEDMADRGFEEVDGFMQVLRQDIATGHPEAQRLREALVYLYDMTGHYPAERDITNEISRMSRTAIAQDAVSFTHHALWLSTKPVIVRCLRAVESPTRIRRRLKKDIDTWRTLFHPHIHPFCSVVLPRHGAFGLVMPLVQHGSVVQYLLAKPSADRSRFVMEAAEGLRYLHEEAKLVHGDFRGINLLVSDNERILVTGYGVMTSIEKNQELGFPPWGLQWGDARWMAPELHHMLNPATKFPGVRTLQSDIYAFGCTALEIWTGIAPFAGIPDSSVVLEVATKGKHPPRQTMLQLSKSRSDHVWALLQACWNANPASRPPIRVIAENIHNLVA